MSELRLADREGLSQDWRAARYSAILPYLEKPPAEAAERHVAELVPLKDRDEALARIFEKSREAALAFRRKVGGALSFADVVYLLGHSGVGCFAGTWQTEKRCSGANRMLCQKTCVDRDVTDSFVCDYWREAGRGLVAGLSDSFAFSRHESLGHAGGSCRSVVYDPACVNGKLGPVPRKIREALEPFLQELNRWSPSVELDGSCESSLYYRIRGEHVAACTSCRDQLTSELRRLASAVDPGIELRDAMSDSELAEPNGLPRPWERGKKKAPFAVLDALRILAETFLHR